MRKPPSAVLFFYLLLISAAGQAAAEPTQLEFVPVQIKLTRQTDEVVLLETAKWRAPGGWSGFEQIRECGPGLDVILAGGGIALLAEKERANEIFNDQQAYFRDVLCESGRIWIATENAGIWVADRSGKLLYRLGPEQGLPAKLAAVQMHLIEPGRVLAAAADSETRPKVGWLIELRAGIGQGSARIFHKAERAPQSFQSEEGVEDPGLRFQPNWLHEYHPAHAGPRYLLVGRDDSTLWAKQRPLIVNLETLAVNVFSGGGIYAGNVYTHSFYSRNGEVFVAELSGLLRLAAPGQKWQDGNNYRWLCKQERNALPLQAHLLAYGAKVYAPGDCWCRLDPETFKTEYLEQVSFPQHELSKGCIPPAYRMRSFGVSSHYGMVGWPCAECAFYAVRVREGSEPWFERVSEREAGYTESPAQAIEKRIAKRKKEENDALSSPAILAGLGDDPAKLLAALDSDNPLVAGEAARRLGERGVVEPGLNAKLIRLSGNSKREAAIGALAALYLLAIKNPGKQDFRYALEMTKRGDDAAKEELFPYMLALLELPDSKVRYEIALALTLPGFGKVIGRAVPALGAVLSDPDPAARRMAVSALSGAGASAVSVLPQLTTLLADPDEKVRIQALYFLQGLRPEAAAPALTALQKLAQSAPPGQAKMMAEGLIRSLNKAPAAAQKSRSAGGAQKGAVVIGDKKYELLPDGSLRRISPPAAGD